MTQATQRLNHSLFPVGLIVIAMASIQSGASLAKGMFPVVGAQGTTAMRLLFASLIMLILLRPWRARLTLSSLRTVMIYGLALGSMNLMFYMALRTIPLGIAVALEFTGPLAVSLYASRRAIDFLWIAIAAFGLALLIPMSHFGTGLDLLGIGYALAAGAFWGLYIIYGQKAGHDNGVQTAALGVLIAALFIAPIGIAHAGSALLDLRLLPAALGVAILSTALPYSLEMLALTRMPARTFSTLMSIEPAFGAISGLFFLHEVLSSAQWLAIGAIITASIGATLTMRKESAPTIAMD